MSSTESRNISQNPQRQRSHARQSLRKRRGDLAVLTHGDLVGRATKSFQGTLVALCVVILLGAIVLVFRRPDYVPAFLGISLASGVPIAYWFTQSQKSLPVMPVFVLQQAAIYMMPLFMENESLEGLPEGVLGNSALSIMLFLILLPVGWYFGEQVQRPMPSKWNISLGGLDGGKGRAMLIALTLLSLGFIFELLLFTNVIFALLPGGLAGLFPMLRTFAAASVSLGALLGGYAVSARGGASQSIYYWLLLAGITILSISGILISAATGLVVAATIGQALGARRVPWVFLGTTMIIIGYLNLGKFTMRERYWETMGGSKIEKVAGKAVSNLTLTQLPGFYAEWAAASAEKVARRLSTTKGPTQYDGDEGQSLLDRINNYQNMVFVVNAQQVLHQRPLWGETYTLIPPLLIPRFLWADKPRAHEGQILLNLHYGRQNSTEDTEKTYVAWGLLPEAVGNFGLWLGPIILGPVLGFLFGLLETWSRHKRLFSVEGLLALGLLLQVLISFEMTASVFLTSTFQMIVAVTVGATALRIVLNSSEHERAQESY